jgi:hypothetical protein
MILRLEKIQFRFWFLKTFAQKPKMAIIFLALKVQKNNNLMSVVGVQHDCGLHIFFSNFFSIKKLWRKTNDIS